MFDIDEALDKAKNKKDGNAQYSLGKFNWDDGSKSEAVYWLKQAAINNHPKAQFFLVWLQQNGYKIDIVDSEKQELAKGLKCLQYKGLYGKSQRSYFGNIVVRIFARAAELGEVQAQYVLGLIFYKSFHLLKVNKNTAEAIYFATMAADQGHIEACRLLQDIYSEKGTKFFDLDKAIQYCEKGVECGDISKSYKLYTLLAENYTGFLDKNKVLGHLDKQGTVHDDATLLVLARNYAKGIMVPVDHLKALKYAEECFKITLHPKRKNYAANIIVEVSGHDETKDMVGVNIVSYYEELALAHGNVHAMQQLGEFYRKQKQFDKAKYWFERAAKLGDSYSQYHLGRIYYYGKIDNSPDYREAFHWFSLSARQGNCYAWYSLAELYEHGGYGMEKSLLKAMDCYKKADELGNEKAKEKYVQVRQLIEDLLRDK